MYNVGPHQPWYNTTPTSETHHLILPQHKAFLQQRHVQYASHCPSLRHYLLNETFSCRSSGETYSGVPTKLFALSVTNRDSLARCGKEEGTESTCYNQSNTYVLHIPHMLHIGAVPSAPTTWRCAQTTPLKNKDTSLIRTLVGHAR